MIVRCSFCPTFYHDLDPETALAKQHEHRQKEHADIQPTRRKRHRKHTLTISEKTVEENIALVREQGGHRWA